MRKVTADGVVNYWINGTKLDEGFYHPSLVFVVERDRVITLELSNSLIDPVNNEKLSFWEHCDKME